MAATRLPGKPLPDIAGQPMIVHVLRRAEAAQLGPVAVATDSPDRGRRGKGRRRRGGDDARRPRLGLRPHLRGAARSTRRPGQDRGQCAGRPARRSRRTPSARRCRRSTTRRSTSRRSPRRSDRGRGARQPNVVKVVGSPVGPRRCARFISPAPPRPLATGRSTITSGFTPTAAPRWNGSCTAASPLEQREKLEQFRALEAGMRIDIAIVDSVPLGVDTPEDLETARQILKPRSD